MAVTCFLQPQKKKKRYFGSRHFGASGWAEGEASRAPPSGGAGTERLFHLFHLKVLSFWLKNINIPRVYLFVFRSAFSLFSGVGEESSATLQKPREGCLWVTGCIWLGRERVDFCLEKRNR